MKKGFSSGLILISLAALTGMALSAWSTRLGPGVGGDATIYLTSAQNLAKGIGLGLIQADGSFRLLPYSAPLFPLILTPFSAAGFDLTTVSRWLNIQLFGFLIFLAGFISIRAVQNKWIGALPAWIIAVSPILLPVYSWAMAEPLTLALGFGGMVIAVWNLNGVENKSNKWIVMAGLLLGLSAAARYSAAAFLATGVLMCLFWLDSSLKKRFSSALVIGLLGFLPIAAWIFVQLGQTASVSSRSILTATEMIARFTAFWPQLNSSCLVWLVPASFLESAPYPLGINQVLPAVMLMAMIVSTIQLFKKSANMQWINLVRSLWLFSGLYLLVILLVYLTTYPPITIDNRMLSPMHTAFIWIIGLFIAEIFVKYPEKVTGSLAILAAVFLFGWYGIRTIRIVQQNAESGLGYNAVVWQQSSLIAQIRKVNADQPIITNEPMAILYLTGRITRPVAEIYFNEPLKEFTRYGDGQTGAEPAEEEFRNGKGYLVIFDTLTSQLESIYGDQADQRAKSLVDSLIVVFSSNDGQILRYPIK